MREIGLDVYANEEEEGEEPQASPNVLPSLAGYPSVQVNNDQRFLGGIL